MAITELKELKDYDLVYDHAPQPGVEQGAIYQKITFPYFVEPMPAIVMTPICDIINLKSRGCVTVAMLQDARVVFVEFATIMQGLSEPEVYGKAIVSKNKAGNCHNFLKDLIKHNIVGWHFLPEITGKIPYSCVDFHMVESLRMDILEGKEKIATLRSPWREQVYARYAACCGRVGVPEVAESLKEAVLSNISMLRRQ